MKLNSMGCAVTPGVCGASIPGSPRAAESEDAQVRLLYAHVYIISFLGYYEGFPCGSVVKTLPEMQEMQAQHLCQEDPLEKRMVTHSSILAWRIPRMDLFKIQLEHLEVLGSRAVEAWLGKF